jgi:hypothetical protein
LSRFRLFGIGLETDSPLSLPVDEHARPDLRLSRRDSSKAAREGEDLVYEGPVASLSRRGGAETLSLCASVDFHFPLPDRIAFAVHDPDYEDYVEDFLLGPVLSYWLERQGIPTLHASAVEVHGQAMAFLSRQGGGKSGLAAALMRTGRPLLTDDVLPVEEREGVFLGRPGYPQMRMWPDEAAFFVDGWEKLPAVHAGVGKRRVAVGAGGFGAFLDEALPLGVLYLPERRPEGPIEIQDVAPRDAVIELIRHSFSPRLAEAAGLRASRFDLFSRLALRVPLRRLLYPEGFEHLADVAAAVQG